MKCVSGLKRVLIDLTKIGGNRTVFIDNHTWFWGVILMGFCTEIKYKSLIFNKLWIIEMVAYRIFTAVLFLTSFFWNIKHRLIFPIGKPAGECFIMNLVQIACYFELDPVSN